MLLVSDVGDKPLQREHRSVCGVDAAPFVPDPLGLPRRGPDSVGGLVGCPGLQGSGNLAPERGNIVRVNDVHHPDRPLDEFGGGIADELLAALADDFKTPGNIIQTPIRHTREIADQGL
ncbi:hypothetical protein D3C80_1693830 [compost metagenome]